MRKSSKIHWSKLRVTLIHENTWDQLISFFVIGFNSILDVSVHCMNVVGGWGAYSTVTRPHYVDMEWHRSTQNSIRSFLVMSLTTINWTLDQGIKHSTFFGLFHAIVNLIVTDHTKWLCSPLILHHIRIFFFLISEMEKEIWYVKFCTRYSIIS